MSVLGVIPARFAAQRFPGKPLAVLWGKPMLRHVWERARAARGLDELVVATDDERIAKAAHGWGARVEMTSPGCASGTDRVAEVARRRNQFEVVLNLQGDEPELETAAVTQLVEVMKSDRSILHGHHRAPRARHRACWRSRSVVKVVLDATDFALYFSRADIANASGGGPGAAARWRVRVPPRPAAGVRLVAAGQARAGRAARAVARGRARRAHQGGAGRARRSRAWTRPSRWRRWSGAGRAHESYGRGPGPRPRFCQPVVLACKSMPTMHGSMRAAARVLETAPGGASSFCSSWDCLD